MPTTDSLTAMDIVVLLLVAGCALFGLLRGFVHEVLTLFAWVGAVIVLRLFYEPAAEWLSVYVDQPGGAAILAFALLFFGAFILFKLIAGQLGQRTRQSVIGPIDRVLGGGFGVVKGLIIASLLFLGLTLAYDTIWSRQADRPEWIQASRTYPLLRLTSRLIVDFVEMRRSAGVDEIEEEDAKGYTSGQREDLNELLDAANALTR